MRVAVDFWRDWEVIAEQRQPEVERTHEAGDGEAGHPYTRVVLALRAEVDAAHLVEREDAEGERGERVHRVVSLDETCAEGRGAVLAERCGEARRGVGKEACDHQDDDEHGEHRRQDLAEACEQLRRRDGQPPGEGEVEDGEDGERQGAVTRDRQDADGERCGRRARDGHERANREIDEGEQQQ